MTRRRNGRRNRNQSAWTSVVTALAGLWPDEGCLWSAEPTADLDAALAFLETDLDGRTVLRASYTVASLFVLLGLVPVALVPAALRPAVAAFVLAAAVGIVVFARRGPVALATARRTSALGSAPALVGRAVLRMRVEPTSERAADFAARTGTGALADSLREHVRRAAGTPRSGLGAFGAAWGERNPPLRRAALLVEAAADAPAGERARTLDRAMTAILDGTRDRMAEFADAVHGPTTALYAFGVLLPLALVAVLPAARVAGVPVSIPVLVVLYDLLLPAGLVVASAWLLVRRPAAFPPPTVPSDHPDVPNPERRWLAVVVGGVAGTTTATVIGAVPAVPAWARWPAAVAVGVGTPLIAWFRPVKTVRDRARAVEANLTDALYLVGRRIAEGRAVEESVADAAEEVPGETGAVLAAAARVQRRLRVGVRDAFLGDHGALADVPSPQARSVAELLALAGREGRPAGRAAVAMADHLDDLQRVEREARRELARVTATLRNTAAVFAPLVGGATVALADGMAAGTLGDPFPTAALGVAVGTYVLLLAILLTALATGLEWGLDRALVGYRVGLALLSAAATYLAAFVGAGLVT